MNEHVGSEDSGDKPLPRELEQQLQAEIAALRDHAMRSVDPLVIAKAVAVTHEGVQQEIRTRLSAGQRLADLVVLSDDSTTAKQVFIRFIAESKIGSMTHEGILVFVDLAVGDVTGVVGQFVLQPERASGRPFVFVNAERTSISVDQGANPTNEAVTAFLKKVGLNTVGGGGLGTVIQSDIASTTYEPSGPGGRYAPEDTGRESTADGSDDIVVVSA